MSSRRTSQLLAISLLLSFSHAAAAEVLVWWAPANDPAAGAPLTTLELQTPATPGIVDILIDMWVVTNAGEKIWGHSSDLYGDFIDNGTVSVPPGSVTCTASSKRPRARPITTAAQAPLPQADVSPAPRS